MTSKVAGQKAARVESLCDRELAKVNAQLDRQILSIDNPDGLVVMAALFAYLGRFVCYPNEHAHVAHALWCIHTHLMGYWDTTPRLAFLSAEPASGKTRALEITEHVVPNPVLTVNVSPAYLFRKVGSEDGATILFDEIDTIFGPKAKDNEEIRGLLNAGYRRGATTGRCVMVGNRAETEEIPAYAAVAIAGLGWLPDTILSRSIIIRMRRRKPGQKVEAYRRRLHADRGHTIRDQLKRWAADVEVKWPELPAGIEDRDADVWEPIIAVADALGGEWPKRARDAAVALVAVAKDMEPSLGIQLLADIRTIFIGRDRITSADLVAELVKLIESPWADLRGKPIDQSALAKRLKEYDIKPDTHRFSAGPLRGYLRENFADAWASYLPPDPAEAKHPQHPKHNGNKSTSDRGNRGPVSGVSVVAQFADGKDRELESVDPADRSAASWERESD